MINNTDYRLADDIRDFQIREVDSTNIEYFGHKGDEVFLQFHAGSTYYYKLDPQRQASFLAGGFRKEKPVKKFYSKHVKPKLS